MVWGGGWRKGLIWAFYGVSGSKLGAGAWKNRDEKSENFVVSLFLLVAWDSRLAVSTSARYSSWDGRAGGRVGLPLCGSTGLGTGDSTGRGTTAWRLSLMWHRVYMQHMQSALLPQRCVWNKWKGGCTIHSYTTLQFPCTVHTNGCLESRCWYHGVAKAGEGQTLVHAGECCEARR
jgi:hypothetical protein